jgi:hypothetical protein
MTEIDIQRRIQLALSDRDTRLWRNNVGNAWQGQAEPIKDGSVILHNARRIQFGLCPGSGDLIGLRAVTITPEMVGRRVAVFCSVEVKSRTGRASDEQFAFCETVKSLGGMAGIVRNEADSREVLARFLASGDSGEGV